MALTLIKEDGTGKVDANSYASAADGDAFHDGHLYAAAWTAATLANKEKALVMATRLVDTQFQFYGYRASETQGLQWPRERCPDPDRPAVSGEAQTPVLSGFVPGDVVPRGVVSAVCEMARELLIVDRTAEALLSQRLDCLIWECTFAKLDKTVGHTDIAGLIGVGRRFSPRKLVATHISHQTLGHRELEEALAPEGILVAHDGMRIKVTPPA